ncbi:MAG: DUF169 domain-containing protein [Syntrophales bacterium]|nr:DUF169 domain-containing protein [Syntrophales bacterium]
METKIGKAIGLRHHPVALLWSDTKPPGAMQFGENKWGCVMWLVAHAARGKTAVCDAQTFGCVGGGVGLGFGNQYVNFPGGEEGFCHFLASGNAARPGGREIAEAVKPFLRDEAFDNFLNGERYLKTPEQVRTFLTLLPMMEIPSRYCVFKPLEESLAAGEMPQTVIFFVDADQLSALVVLANYGRHGNENVIIPFAAGCQTIGIYPYREALNEHPRAVVGLTDLSARLYTRKFLGQDVMSFSVPFTMFREMEANVAGSFLERPTWQALRKEREKRS